MTKSTTEDRGERTVYEVGYLILPSIPEDGLATLVSKIDSLITDAGAERLDGEAPFLQPLAYEMSKTVGARTYAVEEAYLGWTKFEAEPSRIVDIRAALEAMPEVLRFLLMKVPRETTFSFALARARKEQEAEEAANAAAGAEAPVEKPAEQE